MAALDDLNQEKSLLLKLVLHLALSLGNILRKLWPRRSQFKYQYLHKLPFK